MHTLEQVTPLILTFNEEANILRVLDSLKWARQILVVDSFSKDRTMDILRSDPRIRVCQRAFDSFEAQCNYGLKLVETEWVFSMDADYVVTDPLADEMALTIADPKMDGYYTPLRFCVDGVPLKCSILTPRITLFRVRKGVYYQDGHAHRLKLSGPVGYLRHEIWHDDRKSNAVWFRAQAKYSDHDAEKLIGKAMRGLRLVDKVRKLIVIMPIMIPFYVMFVKGGVRDGLRGIKYAAMRTYCESLLSYKLILKGTARLHPSKAL